MRKSILSIRGGAGVVESILGGRRYKRILEIGTYRGIGSAYMSQFCERIVTVDLKHGKMEKDRQVFDRFRLWETLGVKNIDLFLVDGDKHKADLIKTFDFDFAFVDGDHEGNAPRDDFELVKRCGAVLFHDYDGDNGVTRLVNSLPKEQVTVMDIFAFWQG